MGRNLAGKTSLEVGEEMEYNAVRLVPNAGPCFLDGLFLYGCGRVKRKRKKSPLKRLQIERRKKKHKKETSAIRKRGLFLFEQRSWVSCRHHVVTGGEGGNVDSSGGKLSIRWCECDRSQPKTCCLSFPLPRKQPLHNLIPHPFPSCGLNRTHFPPPALPQRVRPLFVPDG